MSLDVYLDVAGFKGESRKRFFIREGGSTKEISRAEWDKLHPRIKPVECELEDRRVYSANITHNLNTMAEAAGIYKHLWRPEEIGITKAYQLVAPLRTGLQMLTSRSTEFEKYNPENGWGSYGQLVEFVRDYIAACEKYPDADVSADR